MLPLQWFSVVVKWIEILFLAMHPSSSNYWMLIFSPTMIGRKHHFISSKMAAVVVCCLCNGSRSWWNGLKYCLLQCIRLHRITGCSFFHPQRLGGILFSFYTFVDWFSSCTHSSSPLSDVVAFFLSCNHSSFFFFGTRESYEEEKTQANWGEATELFNSTSKSLRKTIDHPHNPTITCYRRLEMLDPGEPVGVVLARAFRAHWPYLPS